jgi:hypothetical protein
MEKAATDKYRSIAFPAIGCGQHGCSISIVAQTIVEETRRQLAKHPMSVTFLIQPERTDIYDEFQKQIHPIQPTQQLPQEKKKISTRVGKGTIEVEKGNITAQKVNKSRRIVGRTKHVSFFFVSRRSML